MRATGSEDPFVRSQLVTAKTEFLTETLILLRDGMENTV